jgi:hypothetical protein
VCELEAENNITSAAFQNISCPDFRQDKKRMELFPLRYVMSRQIYANLSIKY